MDISISTYKLKSYEEDSFYIGANSEKGFVLIPGDLFEEDNFDRVFILKGGPGTGKSTFMKKAATDAEKSGAKVCRYYCSSDPDSLDAVIIETDANRILIIDGTHPHIREMKYPGAVSEIINFGIMWDTIALSDKNEEIKKLTENKATCFNTAYKYLSAASELNRSLVSISEKVCNKDKMNAAIARFVSRYKKMKGEIRSVYTEAFSMDGAVSADTYFKKAKEIYYVIDSQGLSVLFINKLAEVLRKEGIAHVECISPVNSAYIDGIYINGSDTFITHVNYTGELKNGKKINVKRFLSDEASSFKGRYRFGVKCRNALLEGAAVSLAAARKNHFELEMIYSAAMNFKKVSKVYREKIYPAFL